MTREKKSGLHAKSITTKAARRFEKLTHPQKIRTRKFHFRSWSSMLKSLFSLKHVVEWRWLSRFPAKMTLVHGWAILSIEQSLVLVVVLVSGKNSSIYELENMPRMFNKGFTLGLTISNLNFTVCLLPAKHLRVCPCFQGPIRIWKCWFLRRGGNRRNARKSLKIKVKQRNFVTQTSYSCKLFSQNFKKYFLQYGNVVFKK